MSNSSYNTFAIMTSEEKDRLCDNNGEIIRNILISRRTEQDRILNHNLNQNTNENNLNDGKRNLLFKRQLTSTSQYDDTELMINDDNNQNENNDYPFTTVTKNHRRKQRKMNDKETIEVNNNNDRLVIDHTSPPPSTRNSGRLFVNSKKRMNNNEYMYSNDRSYGISHQQYGKERKNKNSNEPDDYESCTIDESLINQNNNNKQNKNIENLNDIQNNRIKISQHALDYAVEEHLPPIHINCSRKLDNHQKAKDLIKALFDYLEKDFRKMNKHYKLLLGFEYWFINKNGDLTCFTKYTEVFVYLCDSQNYPVSLVSTNITPQRPKHLPSHHSLVLKFVPNEITLDDIHDELNLSIKSIFQLEEMIGSKSEKSRHLRLEVKSSTEYNQLLQKGGITFDGRLIEIQEFLAPPRLLLCSKCNDPGHIRKNCNFSYDSCRRCGQDRTIGDHKICTINCHRCNQEHMSTDFKCPMLIDYRRSLIFQLKKKPYLLPPNIQIFIPTECREHSDKYNDKFIINPNSQKNNNAYLKTISNRNDQQAPFYFNSHPWPSINDQSNNNINSSIEQSIWNDLQKKQDEINKLRQDFDMKIQACQSDYNENVKKVKSVLLIITAQTKFYNESIERCYTTLNDLSCLLSSTFDAFQQVTQSFSSNIKDVNHDKSHELIRQISRSIDCMKERNNLLIKNQKLINSQTEEQGQLLRQAINSLNLIMNDG